MIHKSDEDSKSSGVTLTDSNVKSCIQKALGFARGKSPSLPEKSEKEKILKVLAQSLSQLREALQPGSNTEEGISKQAWILSLKATEDSLKTKREMYGHSRG
ncbi:MAG: hypothetical protein O7C75_04585 [Verrucomicrobia bacterium]|nr:hypothetical protein [Verrucomicrobiota bacterium]